MFIYLFVLCLTVVTSKRKEIIIIIIILIIILIIITVFKIAAPQLHFKVC